MAAPTPTESVPWRSEYSPCYWQNCWSDLVVGSMMFHNQPAVVLLTEFTGSLIPVCPNHWKAYKDTISWATHSVWIDPMPVTVEEP